MTQAQLLAEVVAAEADVKRLAAVPQSFRFMAAWCRLWARQEALNHATQERT